MKLRSLFLLIMLVTLAFLPQAFAQSGSPDIAGTGWVGLDDEDVTTFFFEKGGILAYSYNGNSYRNGHWSQDGPTVSFEMNKNYRTFKGTIDEARISGTSENTTGKKWDLTMYRYSHPECSRESFLVGSSCTPSSPKNFIFTPLTPHKKTPATQKKHKPASKK